MPPAAAPKRRAPVDRKFVTALARGLEVLRCFGPRDGWLANQEIARRTGLAKPTVSRLCYTLVRVGHLRYSEALNKYALGGAALSLGLSALGQMDVRRVARPAMQAISEQHPEAAVHFATCDRSSMVLVDTYRSSAAYVVDIGSRVPIATTSMGRAYLAALPPPRRRELVDELRQLHAGEWPQVRRGIEAAVREHAEHGWCLGLGDWRREVNAVAVPLVLGAGFDPVVFGCSGAAFQLAPELLRTDIGPRLLTLAGNVRAQLAAE